MVGHNKRISSVTRQSQQSQMNTYEGLNFNSGNYLFTTDKK